MGSHPPSMLYPFLPNAPQKPCVWTLYQLAIKHLFLCLLFGVTVTLSQLTVWMVTRGVLSYGNTRFKPNGYPIGLILTSLGTPSQWNWQISITVNVCACTGCVWVHLWSITALVIRRYAGRWGTETKWSIPSLYGLLYFTVLHQQEQ